MNPMKYFSKIIATVLVAATSCVDNDYNLTKLDTEATVEPDISGKILNNLEVKLVEFFDYMEIDKNVLTANDQRDYCIRLTGSTKKSDEEQPSGMLSISPMGYLDDGEYNTTITGEIEQTNAFDVPTVPDAMLNGSLAFYDYVIILKTINPGLSARLELEIATYHVDDNGVEQETIVQIPTGGSLVIPENGGTLYISHRGGYAAEHNLEGEDVQIEISKLFDPIPSKFAIKRGFVAITGKGIKFSDADKVKFDYDIELPLSFGRGLNLTYSQKIVDLGEKLENLWNDAIKFDIKELEISANIENTLPIGFEITATPLDKDGNEIEDISIACDGLMPGSLEAPSINQIKIKFSGRMEDLKKLDGVNLSVTVRGGEEVEGVALNEMQGLKINDVVARLKANISVGGK